MTTPTPCVSSIPLTERAHNIRRHALRMGQVQGARLRRHEGYIDSWLGLLKAHNRAIFRASGQTRCASEYVLNLEQQQKQTLMDDSRCMNDGV